MAILISLMGIVIAQLEEELSVGDALYFSWVTGTTVGYGDLTPTTGSTRVLAIIVAIMGIILTGTIVSIAIEAAKIAVENSISIQDFKQSIREDTQRRSARRRRRQSEEGKEEG
jgi:hypothetical protein